MSDAALLRFGKAARNTCSLHANRGHPPWRNFVVQLEATREVQHMFALQTAVYNFLMSQDGYWQPVVRCKTPDCTDGNPIYLPHPDLPETTEPQPNWPAANWRPLLVCKYCGCGYHYCAKDVEWISTHYYTGLPDNDLMLLAELRCAQPDCEHLVKVYLGSDVRKKVREINGKLKTGISDATCEAGHAPANPLDVFQINSVDELE
jgi:hypothetical protein